MLEENALKIVAQNESDLVIQFAAEGSGPQIVRTNDRRNEVKGLRCKLLLIAMVAVVSTNTAQAQLRLKQIQKRVTQSERRTNQKQSSGGKRNLQTKTASNQTTINYRAIPRFDLAITAVSETDDALMTTVKN